MSMENQPLFFRCRQCGQSMDNEESTWVVDVKWPAKLKVDSEGKVAYMLAEMDDADIMQRLDFSEVICDQCRGSDVEVKEWNEPEPWMKTARDKADKEKKDKAKKDKDEEKE